ncbi:acyl-CoA dehydrogenase [Pseudomonas sp. S31]|uniref:acyl-CoA dehydrogenase family protein n=1 Tax=Pseudomonas sp. S31 TaxID=1564473 RepID=UPI001912C708|nr:acyl-CoA dehydrogenase [Pseudomonas sp. S31]MBK4998737.1 acyl-CoA dehydrogenase [Pseudomonas sp. S31]
MDFTLSTEQQLLQDNLARFLRERPSASVTGESLWRRLMSEMGLGELVPDAHQAPLHVEHALVMEALGRALVHTPFLELVMVAGHLLQGAAGADARQLRAALAQGQATPVLAWAEPGMRYDFRGIELAAQWRDGQWQLDGVKCMVRSGPLASHFLVAARTAGVPGDAQGLSLFLVPRDTPGLRVSDCPTVDGGCAADLELRQLRLPAAALLGEADTALAGLEGARDIAVAGLCAEARGALAQMLELTRAYLGERRQFGQRLASFQVLQHRLVDMYLHLVKAGSASRLATLNLHVPERRSQAASSAQVVMAAACRFIGQAAVQLHGGMGMCDEVAISRYFRRVTLLEREFGGRDFYLARYDALRRAAA